MLTEFKYHELPTRVKGSNLYEISTKKYDISSKNDLIYSENLVETRGADTFDYVRLDPGIFESSFCLENLTAAQESP